VLYLNFLSLGNLPTMESQYDADNLAQATYNALLPAMDTGMSDSKYILRGGGRRWKFERRERVDFCGKLTLGFLEACPDPYVLKNFVCSSAFPRIISGRALPICKSVAVSVLNCFPNTEQSSFNGTCLNTSSCSIYDIKSSTQLLPVADCTDLTQTGIVLFFLYLASAQKLIHLCCLIADIIFCSSLYITNNVGSYHWRNNNHHWNRIWKQSFNSPSCIEGKENTEHAMD
jgi:hypothetical protein